MSIKHLRERIQIQSRAYVPDRVGGYTLTWADRREFWAEVTPMATDPAQTDDTKDLLLQRFRLRWRVGTHVARTARLKWRDRYLRLLTAPQEDPYRRWVTAMVLLERDDNHE
jgi:head-tail adaptor